MSELLENWIVGLSVVDGTAAHSNGARYGIAKSFGENRLQIH